MYSLVNLGTTVHQTHHTNVHDTYLSGNNFDNTRGTHNIAVKGMATSDLANKAINIGSYSGPNSFTNNKGHANIDIGGAMTTAKGSSINIGLLNLQGAPVAPQALQVYLI